MPSVESAKFVIGLYLNEIAGNISTKALADERLMATLNVLEERHPDLAADLQMLVDLARTSGELDGSRQSVDTVLGQFRSALPDAIREALGLKVKPAQ
jgi:hypothetical protein